MPELKIRAPLACRIAGVDRDRFNEAVARGDYPCAPPAYNRTRLFLIRDVVALFIFGRLIERGLSWRAAGDEACAVANAARNIEGFEDEISVTRVVTTNCVHYFATAGNLSPARKEELEKETRKAIISANARAMTDGDVISQENWVIGNIKKHIAREIEEYRSTLGEEEAIG